MSDQALLTEHVLIRALTHWAFSNTEIERIEIVAAIKYERSRFVAEKAVAQREGIAGSRRGGLGAVQRRSTISCPAIVYREVA